MFRCCYCRYYIKRGTLLQHYIHYSLDHTKGQPLPGLSPRKPLNWIKKLVTKFRCNGLISDLTEKFILRLHRYLRKPLFCSEGG